jgi:PQQ-dependent catabolism-associated CXXCW motif protein
MTARLIGVSAVGLVVLHWVGVHAQEAAPIEPPGYRIDDYRAATPATLQGASVLTTQQAEALWRGGGAIFIDVLPRPPRPANLPAGTLWRDRPRMNIPGSIWLPDTGYGALSATTEHYLRAALDRITAGDHAKMLVVYCLKDCWMSWNAAKRALTLGYTRVAWYPQGTDGWQELGLPLNPATPVPDDAQ